MRKATVPSADPAPPAASRRERSARTINRRLLTFITAGSAIGVVLLIRQLRILIAPYGVLSWTPVVWLSFTALLIGLIEWVGAATSGHAGREKNPGHFAVMWSAWPRWLRAWVVPLVISLLGVVLMFRPDRWALGTREAGAKLLGWHALVVGLWLCAGFRWIVLSVVEGSSRLLQGLFNEPPRRFESRDATDLISRAVFAILLVALVGEGIWLLSNVFEWGEIYSVWGLANLMFWFVLAARVIDGLYLQGAHHVRKLAVVMLVLSLVFWSSGAEIGKLPIAVVTPEGQGQASPARDGAAWYAAAERRLDWTRDEGPVLLVAASGGGSRAALFASLVYEVLRRERMAEVPGLNEIALADRVLATSSVSGGSLASAYFWERGLRDTRAAATEPLFDDVHWFRRHPAHGRILERIKKLDTQAARKWRTVPPARGQPWPLDSGFVVDMTADFMAPLLRGVLNIGRERGDAVADYWRDRFGWTGSNVAAGTTGNAPMALFNATRVDRGIRVVVSFPPAPIRLLQSTQIPVETIASSLEITTAEAVRVSANFPWGFEIARFLAQKADPVAPFAKVVIAPQDDDEDGDDREQDDYLNLIDGGVVDNTGLDTLATLLERLGERAWVGNSRNAQAAERLAARLVRRGLVLVEVDAGARPSEPNWLARRFPNISRPVQALEQAAYVNASDIRNRNLDRIRNALRSIVDSEGRQATVGMVRAGFVCDPRGDVMTAWALSRDDQARIVRAFLNGESRFVTNLRAVFRAIATSQAAVNGAAGADTPERNVIRSQLNGYLDQMRKVDDAQRSADSDCPDTKEDETSEERDRNTLLTSIESRPPPQDAPARTALTPLGPRIIEGLKLAGLIGGPLPQAVVVKNVPVGLSVRGASGLAIPRDQIGVVLPKRGTAADVALQVASAFPVAKAVIDFLKPAAPALQRGGWIYLGQHDLDRKAWRFPTFFKIEKGGGALPRAGEVIETAASAQIRTDPPNAEADLAPVVSVVPVGAKLRVVEVIRWMETSLVWARVTW